MYGRIHGFGPRQHATEGRLTRHRRCAHGDDLGGGAGGGQRWLVVAMATMHRETQRGKKQENERPTRSCGEVTFGCLSFHEASSNQLRCTFRRTWWFVSGILDIRTRSTVSQKQQAAAATDLGGVNELYRALGSGARTLGRVPMFATMFACSRLCSRVGSRLSSFDCRNNYHPWRLAM